MNKVHKNFSHFVQFAVVWLLIACSMPVQAYGTQTSPAAGEPPVVAEPAASQTIAQNELTDVAPVTGATRVFLPTISKESNFRSVFGVALVPFTEQGGMSALKEANAMWTRVDLDWSTVERTPGILDWNTPEFLHRKEQIRAVAAAGYEVVIIFGATPTWAVKNPFACGVIREDYFANFANFAKEAVRIFSAAPYNVKYYEFYNEPDAPGILGCWGDPSDASYFGGHYYGQFLRAVYPTIKAANPSVNLMVGGLLLDCNPNLGLVRNEVLQTCTPARFLEGILASGARDSFDGVAFHAYDYFVKSANGDEWYENSNWASSWNTTGPATLAKASYLRDVLNRAGVTGKFLMNTEIGILCGLGGDGTCVNALRNSPLKTYYVVYSFISSMADGYPAAIWYSSTGDNRGNELINLQDQSPTPAFHAFKFMATKLQSAKYNAKLSLGSGVTAYEMIDNGKRIWVVWATDRQQHNVSLPLLPKEINRINTTGLPVSVSPSTNLVVTMAPVFIEFP